MSDAFAAARLGAFLCVLGGALSAETFRAARGWMTPRPRRLAVHLAVAALNSALLRVLVAGPMLLWVGWLWESGWGVAGSLGLRGPFELIATCVAFDCFDYFWHRANHRWPLLWRFHAVHHSDTHVDATTALRFHAGELLLSALAKAVWLAAWGPSPWGFALCELEITAASQFHHANLDIGPWERRLRPWIMTPRVHASHHTVSLRTRDANFSTLLSVWDRLFGTAREPDARELASLGLPEGREDYLSARALLAAPFAGRVK